MVEIVEIDGEDETTTHAVIPQPAVSAEIQQLHAEMNQRFREAEEKNEKVAKAAAEKVERRFGHRLSKQDKLLSKQNKKIKTLEKSAVQTNKSVTETNKSVFETNKSVADTNKQVEQLVQLQMRQPLQTTPAKRAREDSEINEARKNSDYWKYENYFRRVFSRRKAELIQYANQHTGVYVKSTDRMELIIKICHDSNVPMP
jgi:septal ring factor EnvC (AmiA/AmiB activator)